MIGGFESLSDMSSESLNRHTTRVKLGPFILQGKKNWIKNVARRARKPADEKPMTAVIFEGYVTRRRVVELETLARKL